MPNQNVQFLMIDSRRGTFVLENRYGVVGKMPADIIDETLIVREAMILSGQNNVDEIRLALFNAMVAYARENYLRVKATGVTVYKQLGKNPDAYADIWDQNSLEK